MFSKQNLECIVSKANEKEKASEIHAAFLVPP